MIIYLFVFLENYLLCFHLYFSLATISHLQITEEVKKGWVAATTSFRPSPLAKKTKMVTTFFTNLYSGYYFFKKSTFNIFIFYITLITFYYYSNKKITIKHFFKKKFHIIFFF